MTGPHTYQGQHRNTPDPFTTTLLDAGLTWDQLYTVHAILCGAEALTNLIRYGSDFQSDLWDDMTRLLEELRAVGAAILEAQKLRLTVPR